MYIGAHSLICSDGKEYELKDIRGLVSSTVNEKFLNLPKIFIVDAGRDSFDC